MFVEHTPGVLSLFVEHTRGVPAELPASGEGTPRTGEIAGAATGDARSGLRRSAARDQGGCAAPGGRGSSDDTALGGIRLRWNTVWVEYGWGGVWLGWNTVWVEYGWGGIL